MSCLYCGEDDHSSMCCPVKEANNVYIPPRTQRRPEDYAALTNLKPVSLSLNLEGSPYGDDLLLGYGTLCHPDREKYRVSDEA